MYVVIESKIELEGKVETVYGLQHEDGTRIENISANKSEAERLAEYCIKMGVSPWNLEEIIPDMLDTPDGIEV